MKSEKDVNIGNSLEYRLQKGNWWKNGAECLNMNDINKTPQYYAGTVKEWIEELTMYIYLYPIEWQSIYEQYKGLRKNESVLKFYRNDEGYLRSTELGVVYLKVAGEGESLGYEVLGRIGQILSEGAEELFDSFLKYVRMEEDEKKFWIERIEKNIQESMAERSLSVTLVETLDESAFVGEELYFDLLNDLYMICQAKRVCKIICVNHHRLFDTSIFCIMHNGFDNTVISWKKLVEKFLGGNNDVTGN